MKILIGQILPCLALFLVSQLCSFPILAETERNGDWYADRIQSLARNQPTEAVATFQQAEKYFAQNPNQQSYIQVLNETSYALYFLGRYTEAMEKAKSAETLAKQNQFNQHLVRSQVLQGNVLQSIGVYEYALALYQQASAFYTEQQDDTNANRILNNIANTHYNAGQYTSAMTFYQQLLDTALTDRQKAQAYLGVANTLGEQDNPKESIRNYHLSLSFYKRAKDEIGRELVLSGLSLQHMRAGEYQKAIDFIDQAIASAQAAGRRFRIDNMLRIKSEASLQMNAPEKALDMAERAYEHASTLGNIRQQVGALKVKSSAQEMLGLTEESLASLRKAQEMDNELRNSEAQTQLAVMQAVFNLERKDHQINLLNSKNIIQELEYQQRQYLTYTSAALGLLVLLLLVFFYHRNVQRKMLKEQELISIRLQELDKLKNQVMVNTSHELRTPLNGIIGMTQLLLDSPAIRQSGEDSEKIKVIENCGERLLSLVRDITDFTQLQSGRIQIKTESIDLLNSIQQTASLLDNLAEEKSLSIETDLPEDLPKVWADKERIHQILFNLIGNAIKFSQQGIVKIVARKESNKIRVSVSDEGVGIPEDKINQIFEPFEQIDGSSTRENEGSGLGLPITKELLLLHQSDITVKTQFGKGTTFEFKLPVAI